MRDKSGAPRAPTGSGLGITPAISGGLATTPRAPGHDRPLTALRAARHDRPCATPRAPGADVPPTTTAGAPGPHRPSAAPRAPGHGRPRAASSDAARHDRPCATLRAPGHDVPLASAARVPGHGRPGAGLAPAAAPDRSPVSLPPAAGHDRSRRDLVAAGSPSASVTHFAPQEETVYDRSFTAAEMQALTPAATTPVLEAEIRLLQVLMYRLLALGPALARPRNRRRGAAVRRRQGTVLLQQIAAICHAADVLQRLLKTQQALAKDSPSELDQLLDEAAKYMDDPSLAPASPDDLVIEEYDPVTRTIRPVHDP